MQTIPAMPKTEVSVEDGCVVLKQEENYRERSLIFPLPLWTYIVETIRMEIISAEAQRQTAIRSARDD